MTFLFVRHFLKLKGALTSFDSGVAKPRFATGSIKGTIDGNPNPCLIQRSVSRIGESETERGRSADWKW